MRTPSSSFMLRTTPLVAALACALAPQAASANFTVSTDPVVASDLANVPGSLANAITLANLACPAASTIDIPTGPFTIAPSVAMPQITCSNVVINGNGNTLSGVNVTSLPYGGSPSACDGTLLGGVVPFRVYSLEVANFYFSYVGAICGPVTAVGNKIHDNNIGIQVYAGAANIVNNRIGGNGTGIDVETGSAAISGNYIGTLDGISSAPNTDGIELWGNASTITGNVISGNYDGEGSGNGIYVDDFGGSSITNNKIGTDPTGATALSNGYGILAFSQVTISGNVVSGNMMDGIDVLSTGASVSNNKIGTDATGTFAIPNDVGFYGGSIGSDVTFSNNVVSGNGSAGVWIDGSSGGTVSGNKIGTNAAGTAAIGNGQGVFVTCSSSPVITGNQISGNSSSGISLIAVDGGSIVNVASNNIGLAADGTSLLGNLVNGVLLDTGSCGVISAGPSAAADGAKSLAKTLSTETNDVVVSGNAIAGNGTGIAMRAGVGNAFTQNRVWANATKNIDLVPGGSPVSLANDSGDPDSGPNDGQNYPDISSVTHVAGQTQVNYTLDSSAGNYLVEFFSNDSAGSPAGQHYLGSANITLSGSPGPLTATFAGALDNISATARVTFTDLAGVTINDTSEFSPIVSFVPSPAVSVSPLSVNFGPVGIGSTSTPRTIVVTSTGTAPYELESLTDASNCDGNPICSSGSFVCSTTCTPGLYAPGTSCTITAQFAPSFLGTGQTTPIYVCGSVVPAPLVTLSGDGVIPPPVEIRPAGWDFGSVPVGQTSPTHIFAIANPGTVAVSIGAPTTTGNFVLTATTCTDTIGPAEQCTAQVAFTPKQRGAQSGTLVIPVSTPLIGLSAPAAKNLIDTASATAPLAGTGTLQAQLDMPASIDFGSYTVGDPGLVRNAQITNSGNSVLNISSITTKAPFTVTNDCPPSMAPGDSCHLAIGFTSSVEGTFTGSVSVASNAPGGLQSIALTALAQLVPTPVIHVAPRSIGFGQRLIGTQSDAQRVTISNDGGGAATLGGVATTNLDFLVVGTSCGLTLAAQTSCFADVVMRPVGLGQRQGQFVVSSNAPGSPHAVGLSGQGCLPFTPSNNRLGAASGCGP